MHVFVVMSVFSVRMRLIRHLHVLLDHLMTSYKI